jgi:predicted nucleic acid-binding protein
MAGISEVEAVIDTNVLISDYLEDSENHPLAKRVMDELDGWLVPSVVLEEFVYALRQLGVDDRAISRKLSELLDDERTSVVPIGRAEVRDAIGIIDTERVSFGRFNDKLILSATKRKRRRLATFDRGLRSQCRTASVKPLP